MPKKAKSKKSKNLSDFSVEKKSKAKAPLEEREKEIVNQPQKKKFLSRKMIYAIIVLLAMALLLTIAFLSVELELAKNPFQNFGANEEKYIVKDRCSMILGNLIHPIDDEGACEQMCHSNCDVRAKEFVRFEFETREQDCNLCTCYCK